MNKVNINESFLKVEEYCSPRVISSVEDQYVKIAKVYGTLPLHTHETQDELFIIHKGKMILEVEGIKHNLVTGDIFLVEKGKEHRPICDEVCEVILVEKKNTSHTGSKDTSITKSIDEQLKPL